MVREEWGPGMITAELLRSPEPSVRYKALVHVLGEDAGSRKIQGLQEEIRSSPRIKLLLSERRRDGRIPHHPYSKWYGSHWVLVTLADLGYPPGDKVLVPLREQVYGWLLPRERPGRDRKPFPSSVPTPKGESDRPRIHASMEGNAVHALLKLGLADGKEGELVERLLATQWPDGGWNCDLHPGATNSSFYETLVPLRGLALHAELTRSPRFRGAVRRAAEVFLKRRLYRRQRDGRVIYGDFVRLHYPHYWHYDILVGLRVMAEAGYLGDERCHDALDLLELKRLPDGGFPAEAKHYRVTDEVCNRRSLMDWGGTSRRRMNPWVTVDVLSVLTAARRLG
jgi:hypothetical protein